MNEFNPNISEAEYRAIDAANYSALKRLDDTCPFNARAEHLKPSPPSESQTWGKAQHAWCLEREKYASLVVVSPEFKGEGSRKAKADFEKANAGKTIISEDEQSLVHAMGAAISGHPKARKLAMTAGVKEASIFWTDEHTQEPCKARLDKYCEHVGILLDLKTTKAQTDEEFQEEIAKYDYEMQPAMYGDGLIANNKPFRAFYWLAVGNHPVKEIEGRGKVRYVAVMEAGPDILDAGRVRYRRLLAEWSTYRKADNWPKYRTDVVAAALPQWKVKIINRERQMAL